MGGDGFPVDLVIFGLIAAFLVLRLRSVLGRREGFERPTDVAPTGVPPGVSPVIDATAEPRTARNLPDPASPTGQTLRTMTDIDRSFTPGHFLDGADAAFRMIVTAFAAGDRGTLRPLLTDETYQAFDGAISAREAAGETQQTEIKSIISSIDQALLLGSLASVTVRFVTDQVNLTLGRDGHPVAGADAVMEITDLWTFERDLGQPNPIWRLSAARSA